MSDMSNQQQNHALLQIMQQCMLGVNSVLKDFNEVDSEKKELMEEVKELKSYINELQVQKADMQTKLDQYEIQVGKLNDEVASNKEQIIKLTSLLESKKEERGEQGCSEAQEEPRDSELEMKRLKEQLQQRDSEILNLKQENDCLSLEVEHFTKVENQWHKAARKHMAKQGLLALKIENLNLMDDHKEVYEIQEGLKTSATELRQEKKQFNEEKKKFNEEKEKFNEEKKKFNQEKQLKEGKKGLYRLGQDCQKARQALKELTDRAELIKNQQKMTSLLEMMNLQPTQLDIYKDSKEIQTLLKQKAELEKKLLKAKVKELKKQMKEREEEHRKQQIIREKEAKEKQKRQKKEAKNLKTQEPNENRRRGIWSWFCCSALPED